ncbi:peptidase family C78-domain-containing protein [Mucidula mucida]|nr:peptidase family C78-domain-containing protein [Mucidula mucida]
MAPKRGPPSSSSSANGGPARKRHHGGKVASEAEKDVFWYPTLNTPPPDNYTPGMMLLLKKALNASRSRGKTRRAGLCWDRAIYICGQPWDRGWGCGYRNFVMACSGLVEQQEQPMYFALLDSPISLVYVIFNCYDPQGAAQLSPLVGTSKWIGVSDLYTAFSCRGIPCELVDFNYKRSFGGNEALMKWVVNHFSTPKMPIILQDGLHSRTVVGFEEVDSTTFNLLVFDPSRYLLSILTTL